MSFLLWQRHLKISCVFAVMEEALKGPLQIYFRNNFREVYRQIKDDYLHPEYISLQPSEGSFVTNECKKVVSRNHLQIQDKRIHYKYKLKTKSYCRELYFNLNCYRISAYRFFFLWSQLSLFVCR